MGSLFSSFDLKVFKKQKGVDFFASSFKLLQKQFDRLKRRVRELSPGDAEGLLTEKQKEMTLEQFLEGDAQRRLHDYKKLFPAGQALSKTQRLMLDVALYLRK